MTGEQKIDWVMRMDKVRREGGMRKHGLNSGERQVSETIGRIRNDHTSRYYWAKSKLKQDDVVLDAMCGIGYGSYIMANSMIPSLIVAFDDDMETIAYAKKWYKHERIDYWLSDYSKMTLQDKMFDKVVCFEGIEHIDGYHGLLTMFYQCLKDDGVLLLSTPNGDVLPHDPVKNWDHKQHFKAEELQLIMESCGFKVDKWLSQEHKHSLKMDENLKGKFMLCEARKV